MHLTERWAVISGGTSGIGARTAEIFVDEGARVVIAGRRQDEGEQLAAALGSAATFIRTDVSVEADVKAMIGHAVDLFLASDASSLVNGHDLVVDGGLTAGRPFSEMLAARAVFARAFQSADRAASD